MKNSRVIFKNSPNFSFLNEGDDVEGRVDIDTSRTFSELVVSAEDGRVEDRRPMRTNVVDEKRRLYGLTREYFKDVPFYVDRRDWFELVVDVDQYFEQKKEEETEGEEYEGEEGEGINEDRGKEEKKPPSFKEKDLQSVSVNEAVVTIQKYIRRYLARNQVKKLRKRRYRRSNTLKEFVATEFQMVQCYHELMECFIIPLEEHIGKKKSKNILQREYDLIFNSGIKKIIEFHDSFLQKLNSVVYPNVPLSEDAYIVSYSYEKRRMKEPEDIDFFCRLGELIVLTAPKLACFGVYCILYQKIVECLRGIKRAKKRKRIQRIFESMEKDGRSNRLGLPSYMICPIARIPRYRLLLRDILKNTEPENPDYQGLKDGMKSIADMCSYIDDLHRLGEHVVETLDDFLSYFSNPKDLDLASMGMTRKPFISSDRYLTAQWILLSEPGMRKRKKCKSRSSQEYEKGFFLFNDCLVVSDCVKKKKKVGTNNNLARNYTHEFNYLIPYDHLRVYLCKSATNKFKIGVSKEFGDEPRYFKNGFRNEDCVFSVDQEDDFRRVLGDIQRWVSWFRRTERLPKLEVLVERKKRADLEEKERIRIFWMNDDVSDDFWTLKLGFFGGTKLICFKSLMVM